MKTDAVTEKIIGCYALFLSIHGISVVNSSDWTSNLLRDAECSQGINNHHWVPHGLVFGHTSSLAAPTMLSVFLPRVFKCFHSFLADESPLVSKSFLLSSKVPQLYHNGPFTLSVSAHSLQGLHMAHAPASLKASTSQQTSPDKDRCSLYLILVFQQRYSENMQKKPLSWESKQFSKARSV